MMPGRGEHDGIERVRMHERVHVASGFIGRQMEVPLARWLSFAGPEAPIPRHRDDVVRMEVFIGEPGGRDQHAVTEAARDIPRPVRRKPRAAHGTCRLDDGLGEATFRWHPQLTLSCS